MGKAKGTSPGLFHFLFGALPYSLDGGLSCLC